jgi:hypothetical protein
MRCVLRETFDKRRPNGWVMSLNGGEMSPNGVRERARTDMYLGSDIRKLQVHAPDRLLRPDDFGYFPVLFV